MKVKTIVFAAVVAVAVSATSFVAKPSAQAPAAKGKTETYYYFVFTNPQAGKEAEFNDYYDHQHAPDVVSIPGFMTAQRYIAADPPLRNSPLPSKYLVIYKVVTDDLPAVQAEVSRRIKTGETVINPVMVGAQGAPSGYYKAISPMIPHPGAQKVKGDTYYQFVFSNPTPGTSDEEFNNWYTKTHAVEVVSSPDWVEAQRAQLMNPRPREGQKTYNYVIMFKIVSEDLAKTWEGYKKYGAEHPNTKGPLGENIGVTYKTLGPMLYGDQIRAERAKAKAAKK